MDIRPPDLIELQDLLRRLAPDDDALDLSGVNGLAAAVALNPDPAPIAAEEWMAEIWGETDPVALFGAVTLDRLRELLAAHAADVAAAIADDRFEPVFIVDEDGETYWESWMDGFGHGTALRAEAWRGLEELPVLGLLAALLDMAKLLVAAQLPEIPVIDQDLLDRAPEVIPALVAALHAAQAGESLVYGAEADALVDALEALPPHLTELEDLLGRAGAHADMPDICAADGFLAAIVLSPGPVPIPPEEWLAQVLARALIETFDRDDLARLSALLVLHADHVADGMARGSYAPLFDIDEEDGDLLWQKWISGFEFGMTLRAADWELLGLQEIALLRGALRDLGQLLLWLREPDHEAIDLDVIDQAADLIPVIVEVLHDVKTGALKPRPAAQVPVRSTKVGRNEPCPCGSGKKYKKCCGAAG